MKTKHYDLLNHSNDLNELLAEVSEDTEIVITRGGVPIARLLPDIVARTSSGEMIVAEVKTGSDNSISKTQTRKPNLHPGAFMMSDDFDEPLPDSFWLGEE